MQRLEVSVLDGRTQGLFNEQLSRNTDFLFSNSNPSTIILPVVLYGCETWLLTH